MIKGESGFRHPHAKIIGAVVVVATLVGMIAQGCGGGTSSAQRQGTLLTFDQVPDVMSAWPDTQVYRVNEAALEIYTPLVQSDDESRAMTADALADLGWTSGCVSIHSEENKREFFWCKKS